MLSVVAYALLTLRAIVYFDRQISERIRNTIRIEQNAETIRILLRDFEENASDWLWETDGDLILRHISARFAQVAQRPAEEMEIDLVALLNGGATQTSEPLHRSTALLQHRLQAHAGFRELVVPAMVGTERRWWALTAKPLFNADGSFGGYRGVGSDVTTAHRSRERIAYLARHDTLTDLANRAGFNDAITQAVAACRTQPAALLCLDLDDFKIINDSYGHDVGDSVLRAVGQRIRGVLREHDMAARLGGDEFAVLLAVAGRDEAAAVAARLIEALNPPFACGDLDIKIGISVGIALAPDDGDDPEILYRNADLALYRAKAAGRGTWRLFDVNMDRHLHDQRLLQRDVREALPKGELFVAYQPIVDLRSRELVSLEALVRWRHPERGNVPPDTFVPVAEQSGLIGAIGMFVLSEAVQLALKLPPPVRIAVNLSPLQLRDESLLDRVRAVLEPTGLPHERIEFEITESVVLETTGRSLENLRGLRALGHRVAIDDFGTGYSSLAVLRDFPFDRLKIDRSFITDLDADHGDGPIVKAIIGLGRALGISVTAEGVEYERQVSLLAEYRCNNAQGYYFARPLTPAQVLTLLVPAAGEPLRGGLALPLPHQERWEDAPREVIEPSPPVRLPRPRPRLVRNS
jgi:diguanylate cyclase (GGDEF)-like protein